jgi:hypothetical protein
MIHGIFCFSGENPKDILKEVIKVAENTEKKLLMGIWKFSENITKNELLEVANEWAKDDRVEQLYIRGVSKDQFGIGFAYKYDGSREQYKEYYDKITDSMYRRFGNDFVGWDIYKEPSILIKGF